MPMRPTSARWRSRPSWEYAHTGLTWCATFCRGTLGDDRGRAANTRAIRMAEYSVSRGGTCLLVVIGG